LKALIPGTKTQLQAEIKEVLEKLIEQQDATDPGLSRWST
jgi:hypothetical protein